MSDNRFVIVDITIREFGDNLVATTTLHREGTAPPGSVADRLGVALEAMAEIAVVTTEEAPDAG